MRRLSGKLGILLLGLLWLAGPAEVRAASESKFSRPARQQAREAAADVFDQYGLEVVAEPFEVIPGSGFPFYQGKKVAAMTPEARREYFAKWAKGRNVKGVYILLCAEPSPGQVQVHLGRDAVSRGLTERDAEVIQGRVQKLLDKKDYDGALRESLLQVRLVLQEHPGRALAPRVRFSGAELVGLLLLLGAVWAFAESIKSLQLRSGRTAQVASETPYGAGSLATGLFATMNRNWVRDLFPPREPPGPDEAAYAETREHPQHLFGEVPQFQTPYPGAGKESSGHDHF